MKSRKRKSNHKTAALLKKALDEKFFKKAKRKRPRPQAEFVAGMEQLLRHVERIPLALEQMNAAPLITALREQSMRFDALLKKVNELDRNVAALIGREVKSQLSVTLDSLVAHSIEVERIARTFPLHLNNRRSQKG